MELALQLQNVSKAFGAKMALRDVSLEIGAGTVHAILGENGAGKTTLMRIIAGLAQPDSGTIQVRGRLVDLMAVSRARQHGITMVHQHSKVIPNLLVWENCLLEEASERRTPLRAFREQVATALERQSMGFSAETPVWKLSPAQRQALDFFRAVLHLRSIIILDEPTSLLSPLEAERLLGQAREIAQRGKTVLLVTHKLPEIKFYAEVVTVLCQGQVVTTRKVAETSTAELAALMGADQVRGSAGALRPSLREGWCLNIRKAGFRRPGGTWILRGVDLQVRGGEIVGIAGVTGNGQDLLATAAARMAPPAEGSLEFRALQPKRTEPVVRHIPADRLGMAVSPELPVDINLALRGLFRPPFARRGVRQGRAILENARALLARFQIVAQSPAVKIGTLSGGNVQRAVAARELSEDPDLIVAHNPTAGIDLMGARFVRDQLLASASRGAGILLLSEDLDELLELSDRIIVLFEGRPRGEFSRSNFVKKQLLARMSGAEEGHEFRTLSQPDTPATPFPG